MMDRNVDNLQSISKAPQPLPSRCLVWSGYAVLIWSVAYGFLHLLWALGIGLFMLKPSAVEISQFKVANWVTAGLLTVVGFLGLLFMQLRKRRLLHWLLLAITWMGCSLATSHGIYGMTHRILQIAGVIELEAGPFNSIKHAYVLWDLVLFETWFTIEGMLLAIIGWCYLGSARNRRIWLILCIAGIIIGIVTGLLGVRFG